MSTITTTLYHEFMTTLPTTIGKDMVTESTSLRVMFQVLCHVISLRIEAVAASAAAIDNRDQAPPHCGIMDDDDNNDNKTQR
jgi:hypothetical protein